MNQTLQCARYESDGTIARYVAGTLLAEEVAAFEDHFLLCERCQASVRAGSGARNHFAAGAPVRRRTRLNPWYPGLAAAVIGGLLLIRVLDGNETRGYGEVSQAPLYLGTPVRGDDDDARFAAAMLSYNEARYADALEQLRSIEGSGSRVVVDFFAGASALMLDRAGEAAESFSAVIDAGPSPYYAEALYYRAKAHLQRGREKPALQDLRIAAGLGSPISEQAASLLKQLEE